MAETKNVVRTYSNCRVLDKLTSDIFPTAQLRHGVLAVGSRTAFIYGFIYSAYPDPNFVYIRSVQHASLR